MFVSLKAFPCVFQVSDGKLFTGSHDATLRVWDVTGMKDDVTFKKDDGKADDKDSEKSELDKNQNGVNKGKIIMDDEYSTQNGVKNDTFNHPNTPDNYEEEKY